ncbi:17463_t:CDS:2, partial [Funneliformis geosporum]
FSTCMHLDLFSFNSPITLPEFLRDIATDYVELYIDGDRSFDPKNTLNYINNYSYPYAKGSK